MPEVMRAIAMVAQSINIGVNDSVAISDPTRLRNPLGTPMWLDSILITPPLSDAGDGSIPGSASRYLMDLFARIYIGREQLTNGFVPVSTLDRTLNVSRPITVTGVSYETDQGSYNYIWKFKKPLYVPKGGYVVTELMNTGLTENQAYNGIVVTYRGRSLPESFVPPTVDLPWNAAYASPVQQILSGSNAVPFSLQSRETDLVNPYNQPFKVVRMVGIMNMLGTPNGVSAGVVMPFSNQLMVRITDSQGGIIVRDPTPFGSLFQPIDNSWALHTTIQPHNYYIANLDFSGLGSGQNQTTPTQILIALTGYRTVPTDLSKLA